MTRLFMDIHSENESGKTNKEPPSTNGRFLLFLGTYLLGVIIVMGIFILQEPGHPIPIERGDWLVLAIPNSLLHFHRIYD